MDDELIAKLHEASKDLDIPEEDFEDILASVLNYQRRSGVYISDEELYERVLTALTTYDYDDNKGYKDLDDEFLNNKKDVRDYFDEYDHDQRKRI